MVRIYPKDMLYKWQMAHQTFIIYENGLLSALYAEEGNHISQNKALVESRDLICSHVILSLGSEC